MKTDWMPGKRLDRLIMAGVWRSVLLQKGVEWGVTGPEMVELEALIVQVEEAIAVNQGSGGSAGHKMILRSAYADLTRFMRRLKAHRFLTPPLAAHDYDALGLKPRDPTLTSHYEVAEAVAIELLVRSIREVVVSYGKSAMVANNMDRTQIVAADNNEA